VDQGPIGDMQADNRRDASRNRGLSQHQGTLLDMERTKPRSRPRPIIRQGTWILAVISCASLAALWLAACGPTRGDDVAQDVPFGLGGKADGFCDPATQLCWPTEDQQAMKHLFRAQDELLTGDGDPAQAAQALVGSLQTLDHKLTDDERHLVADLANKALTLDENADEQTICDFLTAAQDAGVAHLTGLYVAAHSVPIGSVAAVTVDPKADGLGGQQDDYADGGLTTGMRDSLDQLRASGVVGQIYAFLFETTGVLDDLPPVASAAFPYEIPIEDQLETIIDHHQHAGIRASLIAGVEGLIPVAGLVLSFSHKQIMDFRNRARMTIEIAALYGIDIRQGSNLYLVTTSMIDEQTDHQVLEAVASNMALRLLAYAAVKKGVGHTVNELVREFLKVGIATLLDRMTSTGYVLAKKLVATQVEHSVASHVLAWLTLGVSVLLDAATTAYVVSRSGLDAAVVFRPWATGMMTTRADYLATDARRRCAALMVGGIIAADGQIDEPEKLLLAAQSGRCHHVGPAHSADSQWSCMSSDDAQTFVETTASVGWGDTQQYQTAMAEVDRCITETFRALPVQERLTIVGDMKVFAAVDGAITDEERARLDRYEEELTDGVGMTNLDLRDDHLAFIRRHIATLLVDGASRVPPDQAAIIEALPLTDRLPFLAQIPSDRIDLVHQVFGAKRHEQ